MAESKFNDLSQNFFRKQQIQKFHKKEIMFVDFFEQSSQVMTMSLNTATVVNSGLSQKLAKTIPLNCVTASMDGFIKQFNTSEFKTKKCFFVSPSGLTAAAYCGQKTYALAGMNNDIYFFSFAKQAVFQQFYAHDDYITNVLFKPVRMHDDSYHEQKFLVTTSADQAIKLWKIVFDSKEIPTPHVLYDHQDEITSAHCSPQDSAYLLASVDLAGQVIVRDLRDPESIMHKFRPEIPLLDDQA